MLAKIRVGVGLCIAPKPRSHLKAWPQIAVAVPTMRRLQFSRKKTRRAAPAQLAVISFLPASDHTCLVVLACSQFNSHFIQPNYFCFLSVSRRLIPDFARWRDGRRPGAHAGKRGIQRTQLVNAETHRLEFRVARVQPSQATRRQPEKKHLKPSMTFSRCPRPAERRK